MIRQIHSQRQNFTVLPQQIQLLKLFHLNNIELERRIQEELTDNPTLEECEPEEGDAESAVKENELSDGQDSADYQEDDIPDYKIEHNNYLSDADLPQRPLPDLVDFRKDLKEQLRALLGAPQEVMIAEYLVDSLNDEGMLEQSISAMADDMSFQKGKIITESQLENVRQRLLQLEPLGIGCTSIKEFLLLQLAQKDPQSRITKLAIRLLEDHFGDLERRNMDKIALTLNIDENELREVLTWISACQMKPLAESSGPLYQSIVIDFVVTQHDESIEVSLLRQWSSTLFVRTSMSTMIATGNSNDKGAQQYLKSKLTSAQWFVSAIKQRETTMLNVMKSIVHFQADYFKDGDIRLLKPMILKDIAEKVDVDISTVSRITCNKYADTHFGTILLKDLFSKGIENKQGEAISNRVIQKAIQEAVSGEDKHNPYTDQQLVSVLALMGFNIARRTVAKYREQQQIPVMQVRALWAK